MVAGSSPLARGLRRRVVVGVGDAGIIPARAGFTVAVVVVIGVSPDHPRSRGVYSPSSPTARTVKDHPRSRGVYAANVFARLPVDGSSPLARGLHIGDGQIAEAARIIPARAGFTVRQFRGFRRARDHPRSRGVYE